MKDMRDKIMEAIYETMCEFVLKNYGEKPEEACYNLEEMAKEVKEALEGGEKNMKRIYEVQRMYYKTVAVEAYSEKEALEKVDTDCLFDGVSLEGYDDEVINVYDIEDCDVLEDYYDYIG